MKENRKLRNLNPCEDGLKYAESFDSLQKAWDSCERGDWMLWLLGKMSGPPESDKRKKLVLIACKCARTALKYVEKGEKRPLKAIQTTEKWARGEAGIEDVRIAAKAANAAYAPAYAAAYAPAYAAAYAAAWAAAYAPANAANAANAAVRKKCAGIVRKMHPKAPVLPRVE